MLRAGGEGFPRVVVVSRRSDLSFLRTELACERRRVGVEAVGGEERVVSKERKVEGGVGGKEGGGGRRVGDGGEDGKRVGK